MRPSRQQRSIGHPGSALRRVLSMALGALVAGVIGLMYPVDAQQAATSSGCRITGRATSGNIPLPGVSLVIRVGDAVKAATSTDLDGRYAIVFSPNGTYHITADLPTFARIDRDVTVGTPPCDTTVDFQLALRPRTEILTTPSTPSAEAAPVNSAPTSQTARNGQPPTSPPAAAGRGRGRGAAPDAQGGRGAANGPRFQTLNVEADTNGAATLDANAANADSDNVAQFLPFGFSVETAQADAVTINGSGDATSLDRGMMNDRLQAIIRGDFDPALFGLGLDQGGRGLGPGVPGGGFGPGTGGGFGPGGPGGGGPPAGRGGDGGGRGGPGPGGGGGGPGEFVLGGRGGRGQRLYTGNATYTFGGSALDSPPYQLRPDVPVTQPDFMRHNFGLTFGGPLKIPGLYADTNRRTNFQLNYSGNRSNNLFDQYATVPTAAMRNGDFSASNITLIDPSTGQPFASNQIPTGAMNPGSLLLARFIPLPNLSGATRNYHVSTTSNSTSDGISLRLTQNLSPTIPQRGAGAGGRGGGGRGGPAGGRGGPGGRGGRGAGRGTNINLNVQLQYRRNQNDSPNVFPQLGGVTTGSSVTVPIGLNILHGRSSHSVNVNLTRSTSQTTNQFSGLENISAQAGILYPDEASLDPMNWGVPSLSISGFTGVRSPSANLRAEHRLTTSYVWSRQFGRHQMSAGTDYRSDFTSSETNGNARGTFTFTGLYASGGAQVAGTSGAGFADFLLGLPQQATVQVAGVTKLRDRSFSAYVQDNWQKSATLTFNLGARYELTMPYTETNGQMANLDVTPDFTAAAPVIAGGTGPFSGEFPAGLVKVDLNNIGPRLGMAYRVARNTILRGGYSITFNTGSYSAVARQLVAQPPFSSTETVIATPGTPLALQEALLSSTSTTTNNWGVDKNYKLGTIQTWNATISRDLSRSWSIAGSYTGTKGTDLDILRAPNRGPAGLLIPSVQPFTWESSGGHSILASGTFQLRRRPTKGIGGGISYTIAKSMDNASSLGAGGTVVAQNDKDLAAEWAPSSFDRRHQITGDVTWELPFGPNRKWFANGGFWAAVVGEWNMSGNVTFQTGSPFTARVVGAVSDVFRGTSGSLRANYTGEDIGLADPTVDEFFNTAAFAVPDAGTFGNSARNTIIGPSGHQVNASFNRNIRLGRTNAITLGINANNLFNTVQWSGIDTNLNSPTFGQVVSVRPMRSITINARVRF